MMVHIWIGMKHGADRPYLATFPPSKSRKEALNEQGVTIFRADIDIPGWSIEDGVVKAIAEETDETT
jgi:hypothetical protein